MRSRGFALLRLRLARSFLFASMLNMSLKLWMFVQKDSHEHFTQFENSYLTAKKNHNKYWLKRLMQIGFMLIFSYFPPKRRFSKYTLLIKWMKRIPWNFSHIIWNQRFLPSWWRHKFYKPDTDALKIPERIDLSQSSVLVKFLSFSWIPIFQ